MDESEKISKHQQIERSHRANALLQDAMLSEAFNTIRQRCIDNWIAAPAEATTFKDNLHNYVKIVDHVRGFLDEIVMTGKLAAQDLEYDDSIKQQEFDMAQRIHRMMR